MKVNGTEYDVNSLIKSIDTTSHSFLKVGNLMLTKKEVDILSRNFIDYESAFSLKDLMIKIQRELEDDILDEEALDELEYVLDSISERDYYDYKR